MRQLRIFALVRWFSWSFLHVFSCQGLGDFFFVPYVRAHDVFRSVEFTCCVVFLIKDFALVFVVNLSLWFCLHFIFYFCVYISPIIFINLEDLWKLYFTLTLLKILSEFLCKLFSILLLSFVFSGLIHIYINLLSSCSKCFN